MISNKSNIANAMSGRTARACDSCVRRRARWYCAADDAFLCQLCDEAVHTVNSLARRHERVRLKTASLRRANHDQFNLPSWNRGSSGKTRTPRHGKHYLSKSDNLNMGLSPNPLRVVPELGVEEANSFSFSHGDDENEQQLYQVPTYDPFVSELSNSSSTPTTVLEGSSDNPEFMILSPPQDGFLTSDLDLEDFAADVKTLLGEGLDEEAFGIDDLGLVDCSPNDNYNENKEFGKVVKEEDDLSCEIEVDSDDRVPFELSFDFEHDFATTCGVHQEVEHQHHKGITMVDVKGNNGTELCKFEAQSYDDGENGNENLVVISKRRKILLRLDYAAVSSAWANQGSPWVNGQRPQITSEDCWPHCLGTSEVGIHQTMLGDIQIGGMEWNGGNGNGNGEREARVSRYREKRRSRLFSKKIRYEVRKLNAEKRPRMKGRFVKRSSLAPKTTAFPLLSK